MKALLIISILFVSLKAQSQVTLSRQVIGATGTSHSTSFGTLSHTVGEAVVSSETSTSYTLNQGFQQPVYSIGASPINFNVVNAFSPNGDGVNDIWFIQGISAYGSNVVTIYNRWGDEIQSFQDYNNTDVSWDGNNKNGSPVTSGTYFYVIEFPDENQQISGWLQITK